MVSGFEVESERLLEFGKHLDELETNLKATAGLVGGCVGDVGLWGLVGQLFGTIVIENCQKTERQFNDYGNTIAGFSDKINEAAKRYEASEAEAGDSILRYKV
ncbi:hypothetical protein ABZ863_26340 [Saccharomonospora sp. NPDC046836]|uniref:hypothetical protein n=1 Tax=Saccharomonospora sp. NPDC046836 TaxID=3156921 RepID=UPI0033EF5D66